MGLPVELSEYSTSKIVILPVPYDGTTSYRAGSREGPSAIIHSSRFMEYYDPQLGRDFTHLGIATMPMLCADTRGPEYMVKKVERVISAMLEQQKYVVLLGGEHTLSIGAIRAYHRFFPSMGVLQIDAHLDLRNSYEESAYNHACAMRRIVDLCPLTQVGIRSVSEEEHNYVISRKLSPHYIWEMRKDNSWREKVLKELPEAVYITVDLDGLDPSIMPAVGTPEPDGLLWHQVIDFLTEVAHCHRIIGFDLVELCPIPGYIAPDYIASKLAYQMIGLSCISMGLTAFE